MLRQLAIQNIVLVDRLELEFEPGLIVLTGETGAGKSILLDALGLSLGARADMGLIRAGEATALVSAEIALPVGHPVLHLIGEQGISVEAGEPLILRRALKADGATRAFVGGTSVPASLLREIGTSMVEVHGQHDERGLLNPKGHRALLDSFGKVETALVDRAWTRLANIEQDLFRARAAAAEAEQDREWLEHACREIEELAPDDGEETRLAEERMMIQRGMKTGEALSGIDDLLGGSAGALAQLRQAARRIERSASAHPLLAEAIGALDRALIEASEAEDRIVRACEAIAFEPARLEHVEARLFEIRAVARKHRVEPDQLAAAGEEMRQQLASLEQSSERIKRLEDELAAAREAYSTAARAVTIERRDAAAQLDEAVAAELAPLKLEAAQFRTSIVPADPGGFGTDKVEFEIATNPGAAFGPLTRIASGGELSRFILALKVALAEAGSAATMIFDEVDRGVGGAVASAIGERLARLAAQSQVIVVTHSPQVAARATTHFRIEKIVRNGRTSTDVRKLSDVERREEIARMLSGASVTEEARAQARRLLDAA